MHLHGAQCRPDSDGHPLVSWRRGGVQTNRYGNHQEAVTLWYHDHVMANTRLGSPCSDEVDTGRADNPLGLPAGEFEVPIVMQDRTLNADGTLQPRLARYQPSGRHDAADPGARVGSRHPGNLRQAGRQQTVPGLFAVACSRSRSRPKSMA